MVEQVYNFYPGPATLPVPVIKKAKEELLNYDGNGMSVMEISHRSEQYEEIHYRAMELVSELLDLPDDFKVLWLQGGASAQFWMAPLNLQMPGKPMDVLHAGRWSAKFIKEAKLYGDVNVVASSEEDDYKYIPKDIDFHDDAAFAYMTSNNTVNGSQIFDWPDVPEGVPVVCDMSSDIMGRKIDSDYFGVIFAGAQKNLGPAGVTMVAVREHLIDRVPEDTPTLQKWKTHVNRDSLFNTPPVFPIYMCKLVLEYYDELGGVEALEKRNRKKAGMLYDVIDESNGFYKGHVVKEDRSIMNVTFNLPTEELEKKCIKEGEERGLIGLGGHRSIGGMRASLYNAMSIEGVETLCDFLEEFREENQ